MDHKFGHFGEIIEKYKVFNVPYYQREYVWGTSNKGSNLYKFIDDIFTQFQDNPNSDYFIGTLAFCSETEGKDVDIIDGQQRITSLILILSFLSSQKCSEEVNNEHKEYLFPYHKKPSKFIIHEEHYLTEEIKCNLGCDNNFKSQGDSADISTTLDRIKSQINNIWGDKNRDWYDNLYHYILEHVSFIYLVYSTIGESLKYFLNINSLSIPLKQKEIFYSILSEAMRMSHSEQSIYNIKDRIAEIAEIKRLGKEIDGYKAYDDGSKNGKAIDNIIYIFINAYYQFDNNIDELNNTGIGKWISLYRNEIFKDAIYAKTFVDKFLSYLDDIDYICSYFTYSNGNLNDVSSYGYASRVLLNFENYDDLVSFLVDIFKYRHNYIDGRPNLYITDKAKIDDLKLEEIARRLNLTLLSNYISRNSKHLNCFDSNIMLDERGDYKKTIEDIKEDINCEDIFKLEYNDGKGVSSNPVSKNDSKNIKVILSLQEAYLNHIASPTKEDINKYLEEILSPNYEIEHLYSVEEYKNAERLKVWRDKLGKFCDSSDFDSERFKFGNLSLLDKKSNANASSKDIKTKLSTYKQACSINGVEPEYLILSLVEDSDFYRNIQIQELGLPKRTIQNINQNTWELPDETNREFNTKLLKMALDEIANKINKS